MPASAKVVIFIIRGKIKVTVNDIEGSPLESFQLLCMGLVRVGYQSGVVYFSIGPVR